MGDKRKAGLDQYLANQAIVSTRHMRVSIQPKRKKWISNVLTRNFREATAHNKIIRDWSSIKGRGGGWLQNERGGGQGNFFPFENGGGGTTSFGVVLTWELKF